MIFEIFGLNMIGSIRLNEKLKRLDEPDAKWNRYRGPAGNEYARPLTLDQQAKLLKMVGLEPKQIRPPGGKQCRGYTRVQWEEAWRKYGLPEKSETEPRGHLQLIKPPSD